MENNKNDRPETQPVDIVITSNSPGELYSFVRPCVSAISKAIPEARIILVITPCQFASGREIEVARSFKEVYEIIFPEEFTKWAFKNIPPKGIRFNKKGIVLYLGGDLMNGVILSKKLGYNAVAYTMDRVSWGHHYERFFVPDSRMEDKAYEKGIDENKTVNVGDLMVDSATAEMRSTLTGIESAGPVITFMPGSRKSHIKFLSPYFLKTADLIRERVPDAGFQFGLSPYTNFLRIEESIDRNKADRYTSVLGSFGRVVIEDGKKFAVSEAGTRVFLAENMQYEAITSADLVITIPGTNTAEIAALGKPMIVAMPTQNSDEYLFTGVIGILGSIPYLGHIIKRLAVDIINKKVGFMALPNRKVWKMVAPELRGKITPDEIADLAAVLLKDKEGLAGMGRELKEAMGPAGASKKIALEIRSLLGLDG